MPGERDCLRRPGTPACPIEAAVIAGFVAGAIVAVLATWVAG